MGLGLTVALWAVMVGTSLLSGIFGLAGGLVLVGVLLVLLLLPMMMMTMVMTMVNDACC